MTLYNALELLYMDKTTKIVKGITELRFNMIDTCLLRHENNHSCRGCVYEGKVLCESTKKMLNVNECWEFLEEYKNKIERSFLK